MAERAQPLLCELHAHTTWSDGVLSLRQLVDLYGRAGFDVLAVTDHTLRDEDVYVRENVFPGYLAAIEAEAARARWLYELLVIPGLELTYTDPDPLRAAHAVAVGLRTFVGVDNGLEQALAAARGHGAALIAAHPNSPDAPIVSHGRTARFAAEWESLAASVDRFELVNRHEIFSWVAAAGLPAVACGDFHRQEHLYTWKTLLPCEKSEEAVVDYLRSGRACYITRVDEHETARAA